MQTISRIFFVFSIFTLLIVTILLPQASAYGVSIGPSENRIEDILRGTTAERSYLLYNLGDEAGMINLTTEGEAAGWIRFYDPNSSGAPVTTVILTARETKPIIVQVTVPSDAANGEHKATLVARLRPAEKGNYQIGVIMTMESRSNLTIAVSGTQNLSGTVDSILVEDTEVNYPVPVKVLFHNTGNVAANPEISASFSGKGSVIDTITSSDRQVGPGKTEEIIVRWTGTNREPGNYTADVKVSLAGSQIAIKNCPFILLPEGTLSRQGNLTSLTYTGQPHTGTVMKIIGIFSNTGTIETKAKMIGEVYRNGVLVNTFTSEEMVIPTHSDGELLYYLNLQDPGSYTIKAYVLFEGKTTTNREISFLVGTPVTSGANTSAGKTPLLPGIAVLAVAGSLPLVLRSRR